jgi:hypothetical protein
MKKLNLGVTVILVALMVSGFGIMTHAAWAADKAPAGNELVIADFNTGDKPNNIGGDFGAWDKDPNDATHGCKMSFDQDDAKGAAGSYSIRLDYNVDSPNPAYNGFWMKFNGENATSYNTLNFYVKGDAKAGYTKRFKIEMKDTTNKPSAYMVSGVTDQWQKISIPFEKFRKIENWNSLNEFVVVFDDINSNPKKGSILIDEISLSKQ